MGTPQYPDVPQLPGVPPVLRDSDQNDALTLLDDDRAIFSGITPPQWGIYTFEGAVAVNPDSIVTFEADSEYRISDYPVEGGTFESYNKVKIPNQIRVSMTKGGSEQDRTRFLQDIFTMTASIGLYAVVTPDCTFVPVNPVRYNTRRTAENGATLLMVELVCQQVRADAQIAFTNSKEAAGADDVNDGPVQTTQAPADKGAPQ